MTADSSSSAPSTSVDAETPPLGSWRRVYGLVVAFFVLEVLLFSWLTWSVS